MRARDRRRWVAHLAERIPEGPQGQPAHEVGAEIVLVLAVHLPEIGGVTFPAPRPSSLLLEAAEGHATKAERFRTAARTQTRKDRWGQPGMEFSFTNTALVEDFFREAMAAIVCAFASLDNLANELLPSDFVYTDPETKQQRQREEIESSAGVELRLSRVAAAATGRPNLRTHSPDLWSRLIALKGLRDAISHAKVKTQMGPTDDIYGSMAAQIFAAPLVQFVQDVDEAAAHYLD